jgi:hypothetical protein
VLCNHIYTAKLHTSNDSELVWNFDNSSELRYAGLHLTAESNEVLTLTSVMSCDNSSVNGDDLWCDNIIL